LLLVILFSGVLFFIFYFFWLAYNKGTEIKGFWLKFDQSCARFIP